jgi:putative cell wall-binding protein
MRFGMKKIITMIMLAGLILMTAVVSPAQDKNISNGILAGVEEVSPDNWRSDVLVWKTGKIDLIDAEGVVIDDTSYLFSGSIHYFSIDGALLNLSSFHEGTVVTFVLDNDRQTILKLIKGVVQE